MTVLILVSSFYIGRLGAKMMELHRKITAVSTGNAVSCIAETEIGTQGGGANDADADDKKAVGDAEADSGKGVGDAEADCGKERENSRREGMVYDYIAGGTHGGTSQEGQYPVQGVRIVIDPGHGGFDSGKVGKNGILEKEINLSIAKKVQSLLEASGAEVIMTRQEDRGLYDEGEANKKQQDMKRRCDLMNGSEADLVVSIHQNSYTEEYVCGPQVFYYETSGKGKELAEKLQEALNDGLEVVRPREIKANDMYYVLRKTSVPTVIVECGFLSNREEGQKLTQESYQRKVAEAICRGIADFCMESSIA